MAATAIYANRILTPQEELSDNVILVEDGVIAAIGHRDEIRIPAGARDYVAHDMTIVPGFVDVHIHGAGGHDVMEGNARALNRIAEIVARHGTTTMLATTVTASTEETVSSLEGIARYINDHHAAPSGSHAAAEIVGIHLEGPFISHAQRGVHPPQDIAKPSIPLFEQFSKAADGLVRLITIAPEIPGALDLIEHVVAKGVVVGIGHTDAEYDQARAGVKAGARHAVHTFNAMRPFTHRDPGVIAAVLTDPEITAELIADGVHVAAPAMQVLLLAKGLDQVILVSDGIAATGMRDGNYRLGTAEVTVSGGVARNSEGKLAGSTLTLDRALRTMVSLGVPLIDAVRMATLLPARRLGLAGKKGLIVAGADADLVALTPDLRVSAVMSRGVGVA
ncbi:MAG TPA: N-acetylglucosamine-6-phosphate deacetylase [Candidatus Acidoferrum sp.]|nr:N-acetylglucosamine-6-phosphate deacetylase [Candidatus Acidoferrum sp.]